MSQVSITLNGRAYRFNVGAGEEPPLAERANYLQAEITKVGEEFLEVRDERLLVMAALRIVDELFEARRLNNEMLAAAEPPPDASRPPPRGRAKPAATTDPNKGEAI